MFIFGTYTHFCCHFPSSNVDQKGGYAHLIKEDSDLNVSSVTVNINITYIKLMCNVKSTNLYLFYAIVL